MDLWWDISVNSRSVLLMPFCNSQASLERGLERAQPSICFNNYLALLSRHIQKDRAYIKALRTKWMMRKMSLNWSLSSYSLLFLLRFLQDIKAGERFDFSGFITWKKLCVMLKSWLPKQQTPLWVTHYFSVTPTIPFLTPLNHSPPIYFLPG